MKKVTVKKGGKKKKSFLSKLNVGNAMADFLMPKDNKSGIAIYRKKPASVGKRVKAK